MLDAGQDFVCLLDAIQRRLPDAANVVLGSGERMPLNVADYWFYYHAIKRAFLDQQRSFDRNDPPGFPGLADYRRWTGHVNRMLDERDDLARVANIRTAQIEKLTAAGITTVQQLANCDLPGAPRMADSAFQRLRTQARMQRASISGQSPVYELLEPDPSAGRQGFALLPPASPNDVCFDIEGYPLASGGLEYLLGATTFEHGALAFHDWWARTIDGRNALRSRHSSTGSMRAGGKILRCTSFTTPLMRRRR